MPIAGETITRCTFVELLKTFELRCEATFAGSVDNENDLAAKVGQRILCALLVLRLEVVEGGSGCHFVGCCEGSVRWECDGDGRDDGA